MTGTHQRGGWLSSGDATYSVLALIWCAENRDLTALPQKSDPSDARKGDVLPRLLPMYGRTKSKRAVGQSAHTQLRPVAADLLDWSLRVWRMIGKKENDM